MNTAVKQILKSRDDRAKVAKRSKGKEVDEKPEEETRREEKAAVDALLAEHGVGEVGNNPSGMYELCCECSI